MRPAVVSRGVSRAAIAVLVASGLLGISVSGARAAAAQACDASSYSLALRSLNGLAGTDLEIRITTAIATCELPESLDVVHATVFALKGHSTRQLDFSNVPSPSGAASVHLGRLRRHQRVAASVMFGAQVVLSSKTRTLTRPNLVLRKIYLARRQVLAGRPLTIPVAIGNPTHDLAVSALLTLSTNGTVLASVPFRVAPRRRAILRVAVTLPTVGKTPVDVAIVGADPAERKTTDNTQRVVVEVTEFQLNASTTVVPTLAGYGAQFNQHVYAAISRGVGVSEENVQVMERAVRTLHPEFSRIFFNGSAFTDPDRMQSFLRTVQLAQASGATINITWQGGKLDVASGTIPKFADVLIDLVKNRGITRLRWLTLQNEPNRTRITPEQYEAQYRQLDPYIQSIRGQVKYMGGDLVRGPDTGAPNQQVWFTYLGAHMADILDAYSIHVFWDYWDTQKLQDRLTEVRAIVDALPKPQQKPLYVAEYGVRGLRTFNGVAQPEPGVWSDGTPMAVTNVSAFQHAWFDILSARLGYYGTSKWDAYFGKYDNGTQAYYMIGDPAHGWPLFPMYNLMHLITTTIKTGWKIAGVDQVAGTTRLMAGYMNAAGQETLVGLDTAGAQLNSVSPTTVTYTIGGLPASRNLHLVVWNQAGDGLNTPATVVTTDAAGVTTVTIPQHAVFVLTTLRVA